MTEEYELESATNLAMTLVWAGIAVVAAYLLGMVLSWALQRIGRRSALLRDVARLTRLSARVTLMVLGATIAVQRTSDPDLHWRKWVDHLLVILLIAAITWLVANLVTVAERRIIDRYGGGDSQLTDAERQRRRIRTQITVLRRLVIAIVVVLGAAAVLMTFPAFSDIGTTLFASAGVLSVVAGLAAQTSLGAVFAGMQIAFSEAIRVGDVVVLEKEWGRIEEITLTYVVVRLADDRRLVLPSTYFTTTPFENWTRNTTEIMGTVLLDVDFTIPVDAMRAELQRLLDNTELWDGRTGVLQMADAVGGSARIRILVSAKNASTLWDLRCYVREGMVEWLQHNAPGAFPHWRVGAGDGHISQRASDVRRKDKADAALFTGSEEAEERARAFEGGDDPDDRDDREFAGTRRGDGQ